MMKQCKKCGFYRVGFDEMLQSAEDVVIEGKEPEDHNFCMNYSELYVGIPKSIVNDKVKCKYFVSIEKFNEVVRNGVGNS